MKYAFIILLFVLLLSGCGTSYDDSNYYDYAKEHYSIDDLFSQDEIKKYVTNGYEIGDIFTDDEYVVEYVSEKYTESVLEYFSNHLEKELLTYIYDNYKPEDIDPYLTDYIYEHYEPEDIYPDLEYDPETR